MPVTRSQIFSVGEIVVCLVNNCPYEAKIMKIEDHKQVRSYLVHLCGFNARRDIHVPVDVAAETLFRGSVAEYVEENRAVLNTKFLKSYDAKLKTKSTPLKEARARDPPPIRKRSAVSMVTAPKTPKKSETSPKKTKVETSTVDAPSSSENLNDAPEVNVSLDWRYDFPENLKKLCIEDRARIHHGQLTRLPAAVSIDEIVNRYLLGINSHENAGTLDEVDMFESQRATAKGLRDYFNVVLPAKLLYSTERKQYTEASRDAQFSPSANYGVVHLLRTLTIWAKSLTEAKVRKDFAKIMITNSKLFLEYLSENLGSFGVEYYTLKNTEDSADAAETD